MMAEYKKTPLELDNTMPKELYKVVEDKWHYCLQMEKEIRETTLARVMPDLTKGQIKKANKKHNSKFSPKYRAFCILKNKIEDVVNKSTLLWKSIFNVTDNKEDETNKAYASPWEDSGRESTFYDIQITPTLSFMCHRRSVQSLLIS